MRIRLPGKGEGKANENEQVDEEEDGDPTEAGAEEKPEAEKTEAKKAESCSELPDRVPLSNIRRSLSSRSSSAGGAKTMSPALSLASLPSPRSPTVGEPVPEDSQYAPHLHHFNAHGPEVVEPAPAKPSGSEVKGGKDGEAIAPAEAETSDASLSKGFVATPDKSVLRQLEVQEEAHVKGHASDEETLKNQQAFKDRSFHSLCSVLSQSSPLSGSRAPLRPLL